MKVFFVCLALSLGLFATTARANPGCDECRQKAKQSAQACEAAATVEIQRQVCRTGLRQAQARCDQTKCKQAAPSADACSQCRKDVQVKAQACQSAARSKAERDACTATMKAEDAVCEQRDCKAGVAVGDACSQCLSDVERQAQACEAAPSEMRRQICRTGVRQAQARCEQTQCKQVARAADACGQCRKDVQLKAQACQMAARSQAERDACTAAMKAGDAACGQRFCQKG